MAETSIEWTERTWNPIVGCSIISPGCTNCYAMKMAARIDRMQPGGHYAGTTKKVNGNAVWTGKLALAPEKTLTEPLRARKPTTWFVNSMGDLFHEDVPDEWIDKVFAVMALCPQHTFQVLTKRSKRMREYNCGFTCDGVRRFHVADAAGRMMEDGDNAHDYVLNINWPLPNVWLGVSAEDQTRADERIPDLLSTPAAICFVSAEPLLSRIDFTRIDYGAPQPFHMNALVGFQNNNNFTKLDWVIVGGESGPGARPMETEWAESILQQCRDAGVPFFMKQMGGPVKARMPAIPPHLMVREMPGGSNG